MVMDKTAFPRRVKKPRKVKTTGRVTAWQYSPFGNIITNPRPELLKIYFSVSLSAEYYSTYEMEQYRSNGRFILSTGRGHWIVIFP